MNVLAGGALGAVCFFAVGVGFGVLPLRLMQPSISIIDKHAAQSAVDMRSSCSDVMKCRGRFFGCQRALRVYERKKPVARVARGLDDSAF